MCRVDDCDERVTVIQDRDLTAVKEHKCSECRRTISAGEKYNYQTYISEGQRTSHKTCAHCIVARDWLVKNCGGYIYGDVIEEINEHGQEYPTLAMPLYRVVVGANRKWQRFSGGLMPVPATPPAISVHEH